MAKLTLTVDENVVEDAKRLAKENGTTVSAMFARFVQAMAHSKRRPLKLGPLARQASGLASLPEGMTYREVLEEALIEKYGFDS